MLSITRLTDFALSIYYCSLAKGEAPPPELGVVGNGNWTDFLKIIKGQTLSSCSSFDQHAEPSDDKQEKRPHNAVGFKTIEKIHFEMYFVKVDGQWKFKRLDWYPEPEACCMEHCF